MGIFALDESLKTGSSYTDARDVIEPSFQDLFPS